MLGVYPTAPVELPSFCEQFHKNVISEDEIADAFGDYVISKACCSAPDNPKKDVAVAQFSTKFKLRYKLSSYVEKRERQTRTEKMAGHMNMNMMGNGTGMMGDIGGLLNMGGINNNPYGMTGPANVNINVNVMNNSGMMPQLQMDSKPVVTSR